ncbi:peptidylprolyl isomerase [Niabella ginsenosidivorans]|uniref:Peptidyl-prolyl cis-trans isomerase n=1 Tax=Niabella ginsenosidivorans TaxID=1176587 RepID=A0A1A9I5Z3_9BACT|nr:FKBP-type peptidyl-prolyl cis-trans isomerase [Niabella ginsenosidivorans]ANH82130.1 peptidylprolyl isomerase [Niabella ginsenosidivorans]
MKSLFTIGLIGLSSFSVFAQTKAKPKQAPVKKPAAAAPAAASTLHFSNLQDSVSYALGINIAQSLKKDIGSDLNTTILVNAMKEAFNNKPQAMDDETLMRVIRTYSEKAKEKEAAGTVKEGQQFLEQNKTKPGVKTTASGLQYLVLKEGTGEKPTAADTAICNYKGSLINGTEFDNSYDRGEPLTIPVGAVIKGWTEGLQLMNKGAKYKFFIPYELAYGLRGAPPTIPGGSALIFEVELLDIKKGK